MTLNKTSVWAPTAIRETKTIQALTRLREEAVEAAKKEREEQRTATNGDCQNGNCQRIVSEEELPQLLAGGWRVSAVLPSGRVVVSNKALS